MKQLLQRIFLYSWNICEDVWTDFEDVNWYINSCKSNGIQEKFLQILHIVAGKTSIFVSAHAQCYISKESECVSVAKKIIALEAVFTQFVEKPDLITLRFSKTEKKWFHSSIRFFEILLPEENNEISRFYWVNSELSIFFQLRNYKKLLRLGKKSHYRCLRAFSFEFLGKNVSL